MMPQRVYSGNCNAQLHVFEPLDVIMGAAGAPASDPLAAERERLEQDVFAKGVAAGRSAAEEKVHAAGQMLVRAAEQMRQEMDRARRALHQEALELAMAVARQVVMCELSLRPECVAAVVERLLDATDGRKAFALRVHPDDAARLAALPVAQALAQGGIQVQADPELRPGGCILETGFGKLDARVETRLAELAETLLGDAARETAGADDVSDAIEQRETPA